jgi:hypothetical protein
MDPALGFHSDELIQSSLYSQITPHNQDVVGISSLPDMDMPASQRGQ